MSIAGRAIASPRPKTIQTVRTTPGLTIAEEAHQRERLVADAVLPVEEEPEHHGDRREAHGQEEPEGHDFGQGGGQHGVILA